MSLGRAIAFEPSTMKKAYHGLSTRYLADLRAHLGEKQASKTRPHGLGCAAVAEGLSGLDLAIIHEKALAALTASPEFVERWQSSIARSAAFFSQVLIPLEEVQQSARVSSGLLQRRISTLSSESAQLAEGNRRLKREIARRKDGEAALLQGRREYQELFLESQVMQKKLRQLTRQIILAQEEERKEISRELHDEVVQTLVGITVQLSTLNQGAAADPDTLQAKLAKTRRLVENSVDAVHRFARELRPTVLDDLGLIPALHAYCKNLGARKKINIRLTAFSGVETLSSNARTVLYRVAQEALTNAIRHAQATQLTITITERVGVIRMEIGDDGKSFSVEKTLLAKNPRRLGLIGMKERIEMVGGSFLIVSSPERGTTVRAEIPFSAKDKK